MKKNILFTSFLLCSIVIFEQETRKTDQNVSSHYPMPKVDRRIELLSIVFRLARNQLKSDFSRGFFWMKGLVESLGVYEKNRDKYPTLESYLPVLIDFYNGIARESGKMFEIKI